jgi:hypothetical protein
MLENDKNVYIISGTRFFVFVFFDYWDDITESGHQEKKSWLIDTIIPETGG